MAWTSSKERNSRSTHRKSLLHLKNRYRVYHSHSSNNNYFLCCSSSVLCQMRVIPNSSLTRGTKKYTTTDMHLAAQRGIPPPYRTIPFRDSIAEGGIAPIFLVFINYSTSVAEIPLLGGEGIAPPLRMLSKGEMLRKGGGGIAPNWHVETPKTP